MCFLHGLLITCQIARPKQHEQLVVDVSGVLVIRLHRCKGIETFRWLHLQVQLLLPHLRKSPAGARVVIVGSKMSDSVKGWLTGPAAVHAFAQQQQQQQGPVTPMQWYAATKLCNLWWMKQLAQEVSSSEQQGDVVVTAVSPGFIPITGEFKPTCSCF